MLIYVQFIRSRKSPNTVDYQGAVKQSDKVRKRQVLEVTCVNERKVVGMDQFLLIHLASETLENVGYPTGTLVNRFRVVWMSSPSLQPGTS